MNIGDLKKKLFLYMFQKFHYGHAGALNLFEQIYSMPIPEVYIRLQCIKILIALRIHALLKYYTAFIISSTLRQMHKYVHGARLSVW